MTIEERLRSIASRIDTVQEHYKDYKPSEEDINYINKLESLICNLEELYKDQTNE